MPHPLCPDILILCWLTCVQAVVRGHVAGRVTHATDHTHGTLKPRN